MNKVSAARVAAVTMSRNDVNNALCKVDYGRTDDPDLKIMLSKRVLDRSGHRNAVVGYAVHEKVVIASTVDGYVATTIATCILPDCWLRTAERRR